MSDIFVEKIKVQLKDKYQLSNDAIKTRTFTINQKNIDTEYTKSLSNIDNEYDDFKKNKSHYSIVNDPQLKKKKLIVEITKHYNNFIIKMEPLIGNNYSVIEQELSQYNTIQEMAMVEMLKAQKNIAYFNNTSIFKTDSNTVLGALKKLY
jgi:hypothetical protein